MPPPCPTLTDVSCYINQTISSVAGPASGGFLHILASGIKSALEWEFTNAAPLWLKISSPDLAHEAPVAAMRGWLLPVTTAVAVGAVIAAGARMALTRRGGPLLDVSGGLAVIAVVAAAGVLIPDLLLQAGDAWSAWILQKSTGGQFIQRMGQLLGGRYAYAPDVVVIVTGALALIMTVMQAVLLLFRQAAIVILAAVLPLAAAGSIAPATRGWIRKLVGWMLALICYKPAAAAVYATAFTMIGTGTSLRDILTGFAMMALSLVALPVLMRFFTWTTGAVSSGGGTGQFLGMAAAGAVAVGALRGGGAGAGGATAGQQATYLAAQQQPPRPSGGGSTASGGGPATPGGGGAAPGGGAARSGPPSSSAGIGSDRNPSGGVRPGAAASPPRQGGGSEPANGTQPPSGAAPAAAGQPGKPTVPADRRSGRSVPPQQAAGASLAALFAAQALASGAQNAASAATDDEGKRR